MGLTLACKDLGTTCPYVAHGETEEELMADAGKHAKEVHGYSDEQLQDPKMQAKIQAAVKEE
jgi:predicted small metal-binding protein